MTETEREVDLRRALSRRPVTDADDLEVLAKALGDAHDHVVDERAGEPVEGPVHALVARALDEQHRSVLADGDVGRQRARQRTSGPLDRDLAATQGDLDARRDVDR